MLVDIVVVPKSGCFSVSVKEGKVKIRLRSAPEDNKANLELVKELKKALGAEVRIVSGIKSRHKTIEIAIGKDDWDDYLRSLE